MWEQVKRNGRLILTAAIGLVAGGALGVFVGFALQNSDEEAAPTGHIGTKAILPTTHVERQVQFEKCGHTRSVLLDTNAFIGYTEQELADFYEACTVAAFSSERVTLTQELDACCPAHVLLQARGDGTACVYQTDAEFFIEQLVRVVALDVDRNMTPDEKEKLSQGVVFDTLADVDAYLESLES